VSRLGFGQSKLPSGGGPWAEQRLIVFTEYADTKRYLTQLLQGAIDGTPEAERRIVGFHGAMSDEQRERVQEGFNGDPKKYPVRILIATDAAREGLTYRITAAISSTMTFRGTPRGSSNATGVSTARSSPRKKSGATISCTPIAPRTPYSTSW
jgi:hypothetical protein